MGGIGALLIGGLAGGGAPEGGVAAGATDVGGIGAGWTETGAVTDELKVVDFNGISFPVMGRMTGGCGCSSVRLESAASSD